MREHKVENSKKTQANSQTRKIEMDFYFFQSMLKKGLR